MNHAQILNGTIDPNWVIAIAMIVLGFLLVRILNRIEKKQDQHDTKINDHEVRLTVIEKIEENERQAI